MLSSVVVLLTVLAVLRDHAEKSTNSQRKKGENEGKRGTGINE
jgi:hypothetical protein